MSATTKKLASLMVKIGANGAEAEKVMRDLQKRCDKWAKSVEKIGSELTRNVTAPYAALAGVSVAAADRQLQAETRLLTALRGREDIQRKLIASAAELQSRSKLGDEAIIEQQAYLASLGLTEQQIGSTIEAAAQLSSAMGIELESAVRNLAKTYGGLAGELGESIPALRNLTKEELAAGAAIAYVNENYRGFAEAAATTGAGPLIQLKNQLGDLAEKIGTVLMPALQKLVEWMSTVVSWLQSVPPETIAVVAAIGGVAAAIGPLLTVVAKLAKLVPLLKASFTALAASPIAAGVLAVGAAFVTVANNTATARRELEAYRDKLYEERKQEAYNRALEMYDRASVSDTQLANLIKDYKEMLDADVSTWQAMNGGGLNEEQRKALSVQKETIRALEDIQSKRERAKKDEAAITKQHDKQKKLTDEELLAKMRLERVESKRLDRLHAIIDAEERAARMRAQYQESGGKLEKIEVQGVDLTPLNTVDTDLTKFSLQGLGINRLRKVFEEGRNEAEYLAGRAIEIGDILRNSLMGLATSIAEGFGNLFAGEEFNFGGTLLRAIGSFLKDLGKRIIETSALMEALKATLKGAGLGAAAIPIGMAAMALGQGLISAANKPIKLATGALAYGPTLAVVGDNVGASYDPEVIAPLSKLSQYMGGQQLELVGAVRFELSGDTARAILDRENFRIKRRG